MDELHVKFVSPQGKTSKHVIYCKKHALRKNSSKTPNGRTLFSVGWPPYCKEDDIKELFSRTSEIESVFLRSSPGNVEDTEEEALVTTSPFRRRDFSYVVFKTTGGLAQMLSLCKSKTPISCPITNTGLSVLLNDYNDKRPPVAVLEAMAKRVVEKYDSWTEQEKTRKRLLSEPDEEGWVTIAKRAPAIEPEGLVGVAVIVGVAYVNVHVFIFFSIECSLIRTLLVLINY